VGIPFDHDMPPSRTRAVLLVALVLVGLLAVALDAAGRGCGRGNGFREPWCGPDGREDRDGGDEDRKDKDSGKREGEDDEDDDEDAEGREDDKDGEEQKFGDEGGGDDQEARARWVEDGVRGLWPFPVPPPEAGPEGARPWRPGPCGGDCGAPSGGGDPPPRLIAGILAAVALAGGLVAWRTR